MLFTNKSAFLAELEYLFEAKSVSPITTIAVCASVPSCYSLGLLPISEIASINIIVGKGPSASDSELYFMV